MKNIPEIRFDGFSDEWEEHKLGDVAPLRGGFAFKSEEYCDYGIPIIRISNILSDGTVGSDFSQYNNIENDENIALHNGDALLAMSGATTGKVSILHCKDTDKYYQNQRVGYFTRSNLVDYDYISTIICSPQFTKQLSSVLATGAQPNVSSKEIDSFEFMFPKEIKEQTKIGQYLSNLNHLITLYQQKLDMLKNNKKALLDNMFPKDGENMPKVRFEGFTEAWEQHKLLDCVQKITDFRGRTPKKLGMDWSNSGYLALSALNVKDGYIDFMQDTHYGSQELYNKWMNGNELHKGQVLFTTEAPMGNVVQIPDNEKYILSQRVIAFDANVDFLTNSFLATILKAPVIFGRLTALTSGGTAKGISQKSLATVDITIPKSLSEQNKLANLFLMFSYLITTYQKKLNEFQNIKNSLSQKMFA